MAWLLPDVVAPVLSCFATCFRLMTWRVQTLGSGQSGIDATPTAAAQNRRGLTKGRRKRWARRVFRPTDRELRSGGFEDENDDEDEYD